MERQEAWCWQKKVDVKKALLTSFSVVMTVDEKVNYLKVESEKNAESNKISTYIKGKT
jgi:hypothetical protein